jgi:hypothetical protein
MKSKLFLKLCIGLPLVFFIDYILMAILGCTSCLFGVGESFYCGSYCLLGKGLLLLSAVLLGLYLYPDIRKLFYTKSHASS